MNRLTRHIVAEIIELFFAVLIGIVFIIMSFRFAALLSEAASGKIVGSAIFKLLGLFAVNSSEYLIPFAFFIAIVAVLVRYSMSGEYVAMRALGYGQAHIQRTLLLAALPVTLALLFLSFAVYPQALDMSFKMLDQAREEGETSLIQPGQFRNLGNQTILYVAETGSQTNLDSEKQSAFKRFFLYQPDANFEAVTTAAEGKIVRKTDADGIEKRTLVLSQGSRIMTFHDGSRAGQALRVSFATLDFNLPEISIESRPNKVKTKPTLALLNDTSTRAKAEIQRRVATALSVPILALLAWLLISDKPRKSQYAAFGFAILIYLIYTVNQTVIVGLVEKGTLPLLPGAYFVPLIAFAIYFGVKRCGDSDGA